MVDLDIPYWLSSWLVVEVFVESSASQRCHLIDGPFWLGEDAALTFVCRAFLRSTVVVRPFYTFILSS